MSYCCQGKGGRGVPGYGPWTILYFQKDFQTYCEIDPTSPSSSYLATTWYSIDFDGFLSCIEEAHHHHALASEWNKFPLAAAVCI
jgi:hypothetical protein